MKSCARPVCSGEENADAMLRLAGVVLACEGARVRLRLLERAGGCGRCHEAGGCQSVSLTRLFAQRGRGELELPLAEEHQWQAGDAVWLLWPRAALLRSAALGYGLPLLLLLAGAIVGTAAGGENGAVAGGAAGLLLGLLVPRLLPASSPQWRLLRRERAEEGQ